MKLKGKAAIITGATSGIGEASAVLFAQEGAKVTVVGRSAEGGKNVVDKIVAAGGEAIFVRADVSRFEDIKAFFDAHMKRFGRLDVLLNNASDLGPGTTVAETSEEDLDRVLATNFKSVFLACKLAAPIMLAAGSGSIISTTSALAREGFAWPNLGAYIGSKGATIAFTRSLAMELSPHGVRVNTLSPGLVDTPMLRNSAAKQPDPDAFWKSLPPLQLMQRIGTSDELARAALFLASDDSSFVTGTDILVDGGIVLG